MNTENPQTPKASRSGAAAEGSQSPSQPCSDYPECADKGCPACAPAGSEGRQSPGLAPCPFCGVLPKSASAFGVLAAEHPMDNDCYFRGATWPVEHWNRRALAAPGAPQGGGACRSFYLTRESAFTCGRCNRPKSEHDEPATPSQEEGPAGVDLEAVGKAVRWMGWWIGSQDCDCEDGHRCGLPERAKECAEAVEALARLRAQAPASILDPKSPGIPASTADTVLHFGAPASSPRDLEAVRLDISSVLVALALGKSKADPKERAIFEDALEALARLHPPKGETPSEAAPDFDAYWGNKGEKWKGWLDIKNFAREVWEAARAGRA